MQGTKVLEDREIRHNFSRSSEDAPPKHASPGITKYTGAFENPEWKDVEPGRVFTFPWYLVKSAQSPKDKFETLCYVKADISSAPYTSQYTEDGEIGYERKYGIILLVGLTELKAQVSWIDSRTVRAYLVMHVSIYLTRFPHARIQRTEKRFAITFSEFLIPRLNSIFRSNAVVVYDDPSEGA